MKFAGQWNLLNSGGQQTIGEDTIRQLESAGFHQMTAVQMTVIPKLRWFKDVVVEAETGSGKTLAFLIPCLEILKCDQQSLCLIIAPTRELVQQILEVSNTFFQSFRTKTLIGGTEISEDVASIAAFSPRLIIGTPGRLFEMIDKIDLRNIGMLIVDEADRILRDGMEAKLTIIFSKIPKQRRTGLFSATMSQSLKNIVFSGCRNPFFIRLTSEKAVPMTLYNWWCCVDPVKKIAQLVNFLRGDVGKVLVFVLSCLCVDFFQDCFKLFLNKPVFGIHGKMAQKHREENMRKFKETDESILIATDVAARGIDVPSINWIVQFDPPLDPSTFVHRVGRTARIGNEGNALLLLREHEDAFAIYLEQKNVQIEERQLEIPPDADEMLGKLRKEFSDNPDFHDKVIRAFVSYVRAYHEHKLKLLMKMKDLNLYHLAESFGITRLPKMPELKDASRIKEFNERKYPSQ